VKTQGPRSDQLIDGKNQNYSPGRCRGWGRAERHGGFSTHARVYGEKHGRWGFLVAVTTQSGETLPRYFSQGHGWKRGSMKRSVAFRLLTLDA